MPERFAAVLQCLAVALLSAVCIAQTDAGQFFEPVTAVGIGSSLAARPLPARAATPVPTPVPTATPTPMPSPYLTYAYHSVIVFAQSSDAPTAARVSVEVARQFAEIDELHTNHAAFIPQPGWSLGDYLRQCSNDPNTVGGVLIVPVTAQSASDNYLIGSRSWMAVDIFGMFLDCPPNAGPLA